MGRRLIIKNADFSANGVIVKQPTWYMSYSDAQLEGNASLVSSNTFYVQASEISSHSLTNKVVEYVKIYAKASGTMTIASINTSGTGSIISSFTYSVTQGINIIKLTSSITLTGSVSIGFSGNGIVPMWYNGDYGFAFSRVAYTTSYAPKTIPVDLGILE